jgi:hypothetical protein
MVTELSRLEMERRSEQSAVDRTGRQTGERLGRTAHLDQCHVTVRLEIPLAKNVAQ